MTVLEKLKNKGWWKRVLGMWLMFFLISIALKYFVFRREELIEEVLKRSVLEGFIFSFLFNLLMNPGIKKSKSDL
jgi:hypothetical protein